MLCLCLNVLYLAQGSSGITHNASQLWSITLSGAVHDIACAVSILLFDGIVPACTISIDHDDGKVACIPDTTAGLCKEVGMFDCVQH
jgi:hypothetical protein